MSQPSAFFGTGGLRRLVKKGGWTVVDQGLFAGTNFLVNVLLARWLTAEAFGAFTTAYVGFLLVGTLHAGLIVEPMLVYGPGRYRAELPVYLRRLMSFHLWVSVLGAAGLLGAAGIAWWIEANALASALAVLAACQPFILLLWLFRRACYIESRPALASVGGAAYLALVLGGASTLQYTGRLSVATALLAMSGASLVVGAGLAVALGVRPRVRSDSEPEEVEQVHWRYGRWAVGTGALEWLRNAMPFLIVPLFAGMEGNALLRAVYNLAMPALHAFSALTLLALPMLVRAREAGGLGKSAVRMATLIGAAGLVYFIGIAVVGSSLMEWMYDGKYIATTAVLLPLAALPLLEGLVGVLTIALRAQERPDTVFRTRGVAGAIGVPVMAALTAIAGVAGALGAAVFNFLVEGTGQAILLRRQAGEASASVVSPSSPVSMSSSTPEAQA